MAHIVVQLHGQEISRLELEQGHEYLVGRAEDIAICLPPEKGISRHHLKIYQKDSIWFVELLARFGSLYLNGNKLSAIELKETTHFSSPPFEFDFVVPIQQIETHLPSLREDGAPPKQVALSHHAMVPIVQNEGIPQGWPTQEDLQGNSEMTVVAKKQLTPFLKISSEQNLQEETIKLEGQLWVAGRDPHCEIPLADHRASRRHFEISHTEEGFFITDLNSANGTLLNEEPITPNESWQLTSGDVIQVSKVKLIFEVRDLSYSNQLPALLSPQQEANALSQYVPMGSQPFYPQSQLMSSSAHLFSGASVIKLESPNHLQWKNPQTWKLENFKKIDFKKNRVKILIGIMIPFILIGLIPQKEKRVELPSTTPTFDKLTVEQKRAVKDSFNLAKSMFMQGKYELCLSEIQKLHGVVPSYENSNEIKDYCKQGADLALLQRDKERRDQAKAESNRLITQTVEDCRKKLNPSTRIDQIRECLSSAIERDPENPLILNLIQAVEVQEMEQNQKKQSMENFRIKKAMGLRILEKAKKSYKEGDLLQALSHYEQFIKGKYPIDTADKENVNKELSSIRAQLSTQADSLAQNCKQFLDKSQFKAAFLACAQVLKVDPANGKAKTFSSTAVLEMHRELKSIYEDSILEESMGNIDSAKERWKQIIDKGLASDDYFNKAKQNLQKYGVPVVLPSGDR